jgi:hypothetical protein
MDIVLSLGFAEYANRGTLAPAPSTTINRVEPLIPADVAVISGLPMATPIASPAPLIVASVVSELLQVAVAVISSVLPSLNVPFALNCFVPAVATDGFAGVTWMDVSTFVGGGGEDWEPQPPRTEQDMPNTSKNPAEEENPL